MQILDSGVWRWLLMDFLLCSNHRPEVLTVPGAVHIGREVSIKPEAIHSIRRGIAQLDATMLVEIQPW